MPAVSPSWRLLDDPAYPLLKERVIEATGLAYYRGRDEDLAERISRRLAAVGLPDGGAYLAALDGGPAGQTEMDALIAELTIGETYFFRHPEQFETLNQIVLPELVERNSASRRLRLWSAGCATGAEAYSLAMLLTDHWGERLEGWDISILGTDINRQFLARAAEGRFEEWALRSLPEADRARAFRRDGRSWLLDPRYKRAVSFRYHNLVRHPLPSLVHNLAACDLIVCRNVIIYFSAEVTRALVTRLGACLADGGWLLVGHAEHDPESFRAFRAMIQPGATLYQKPGAAAPDPPAGVWEPPVLEPVAMPVPAELPVPVQHRRFSNSQILKFSNSQSAPDAPSSLDQIRALADRGDWEEADRGCRRLLEAEPLNAAVHLYHALVLEPLGRTGEGEQALRRALYLDRRFALAHYHLGLLLAKTQRLPQARRALQNAQELLAGLDGAHVLADADGLTAAELGELVVMQLEVLRGAG